MIPNSAKIVNTTVDITQYINTEYFSINNNVAYLVKIGKLRMIKVDVTLKKAITKDTYVFNFPSNFLKGMINTYFFGNVINRNGKAYEVAFYNQLASNNFSILLQVTAGNTIENNSRLIGEWTGFCSADINDISEEENQFITYNQFNTLISETLKDYTKNMVLEESQTKQDKLIQKLQNNMIQESTEEATSLHVEDASDLPAVLNISGNYYQEQQEGTDNLTVLTEGTIERDGNKIIVENGIATLSGSNQSSATNYIKVGTAYLYKGKKYYINNIRSLTAGSHGALLRGSTTKWFTANTELEWECPKTGEWDIEITYSAGQFAAGTEKFLISETSKATWIQGKKAIPSVEYPSEISTIKDNIKIIQCNSNFLKKQEKVENVSVRGLVGQVLDDGTIVLNGTTTNDTYIQLTDELKIADYNASKNFEKHVLPSGSYKFISETSGQVSANDVHAFLYHADTESFLNNINIQRISESPKKETSFELAEKWRYYTYLWIKARTTLTDFKMKFMLKREDDNSEYIQNEQKEYNLAVQQEMLKNDKFDLLKNKEILIWKKLILNGTENWQQSSTVSSVFYLNMQDTTQDKTKFKLISNQYSFGKIIVNSNEAKHNKIYGFISEGILRQRILLRNDNFTTLDSFKASLAEKNMTLYYVSDTTTELELTEEQKETLNQLNNLELFKGVNNIYTEQDLALLQLNYTADTKMYIDNKINSIAGGN